MMLMICTAVVVICVGYLWWKYSRPKDYPPGPPMLPVVGSIPFIIKYNKLSPLRRFEVLAETYGSIYSMALGSRKTVMVTGFNLIHEALVDNAVEFAGRTDSPFKDGVRKNPNQYGLIKHKYTSEYKAQRHVSIALMKSIGYGKSTTEEKILEEAQALVQEFHKHGNKAFNPHETIHMSASNVICYLLWCHRYQHDDEEFQRLLLLLSRFLELIFAHPEIEFLPITRCFSKGKQYIKEFREAFESLDSFLSDKIRQRQKLFEETQNVQDFIQAYTHECRQEESKITQDWLKFIIWDFFIAGSDTTSTTLTWGLLYMIAFPDVQRRVQEEIDLVLGAGATSQPHHQPRRVALSDRSTMPYTEATIMEVQRFSSFLPISLPHETMKDVKLGGYMIPQGTSVLFNLHQTTRDPSLWEDPDDFRPERFIDDKGEVVRPKHWIPFSMGRRSCPGEQLARQELFLLFVSMLHSFEFSSPVGSVHLDLEAQPHSINQKPAPFEVIAKARLQSTH